MKTVLSALLLGASLAATAAFITPALAKEGADDAAGHIRHADHAKPSVLLSKSGSSEVEDESGDDDSADASDDSSGDDDSADVGSDDDSGDDHGSGGEGSDDKGSDDHGSGGEGSDD